jgi:DNA-binding NtrC family response regulator
MFRNSSVVIDQLITYKQEIVRVRILVVEDERKLARALKEGLEADNHAVSVAYTGEDGFFLIHAQPFDLSNFDQTCGQYGTYRAITKPIYSSSLYLAVYPTARSDLVRGACRS